MSKDKKLYTWSLVTLVIAFIGGLANDRLKSDMFGYIDNCVYILFFALFVLATYFYTKREHELSVTIELLCVELTGAAFFTMELLFNGNPDADIVVGILSFALMWTSFFLTLIKFYKEVIPEVIALIRKSFTRHIMLWVILIVYAVMFTANYSVWYRGDSFTYFSAASLNLDMWDYTLSKIHAFMMGGHLTYSYNFLLNIFLLPLRGFGVREEIAFRIANLVISEVTLILFYATCCKLFKNLSAFARGMLLAAFTFAPLFWGISYLASSDFALLCFFVLFIFAYCYDLKIMKFIGITCMCFTKETAILLPLGFFIGSFIYEMASQKGVKPLARIASFIKKNLAFIAASLIFTINMFLGQRGWIHDFHDILKQVILGIPRADLPDKVVPGHYQLFKLNSLFTAHFMWVVTALIVIYLIYAIAKKPGRSSKSTALIISLIVSAVCYYGFELVYFNYVHYRYSQYNLLIMMLLLGFALNEMVTANLLKNLIPVIVTALFLTECYVTIDPITRMTWNTFDSGNGEAVTMQMYFYQVVDGIGYVEGDRNTIVCTAFLNDGIDHNREIIGLQRCIEEGFREICYDDSKAVVIDSCGDFLSLSCLGLFGYPEHHSFSWVPGENAIYTKYKDVTGDLIGDETLPGYPLNLYESSFYGRVIQGSIAAEKDYREVYYLDVGFNPNIPDYYLEGREILNTRVITNGIWQIRMLRLKPLES